MNTDAEVHVSKLDFQRASVQITESGVVVWQQGQYHPGVKGIVTAKDMGAAVVFTVGSGTYHFRVTGDTGHTVCAVANEVTSTHYFLYSLSIE